MLCNGSARSRLQIRFSGRLWRDVHCRDLQACTKPPALCVGCPAATFLHHRGYFSLFYMRLPQMSTKRWAYFFPFLALQDYGNQFSPMPTDLSTGLDFGGKRGFAAKERDLHNCVPPIRRDGAGPGLGRILPKIPGGFWGMTPENVVLWKTHKLFLLVSIIRQNFSRQREKSCG